ncbi:MAG: methyltransferase domain-containing protein [Epsilonproteobacteria bacterium]|nr:methyltransferase domain-containing protein [Campylobacterota bacterium]
MGDCLKQVARFINDRAGVTFEKKEQLFRLYFLNALDQLRIRSCEELYEMLKDQERFYKALSYFLISQSYFNRESRHFEIMVELLDRKRECSILSIPCANGEEPYSIAIWLKEHGFERFRIDGIDINPVAIERAREGVYEARTVSQLPDEWIRRYFFPAREGYRVVKEIRRHVHFEVENLFDLYPDERYDMLFCRNLLIYLDEKRRQEAIWKIHGLLRTGGYLFLGFSDYIYELEGFDRISFGDKEIYRKRE